MNGESVNIIGAAAAAIASCVVLILLIYKSTAADILGGSGISFTGAQTAAKAAAGTYRAAASTAGAAGSLAKRSCTKLFGSNTQSNGALVVLQAGEAMRNNSNSRGIGSISPTNNAPPSRRPIPSVNSK